MTNNLLWAQCLADGYMMWTRRAWRGTRLVWLRADNSYVIQKWDITAKDNGATIPGQLTDEDLAADDWCRVPLGC